MPCAKVSFAPAVLLRLDFAWASHGLWRSLVAHLTGGQGVAGSNPVSPTSGVRLVHTLRAPFSCPGHPGPAPARASPNQFRTTAPRRRPGVEDGLGRDHAAARAGDQPSISSSSAGQQIRGRAQQLDDRHGTPTPAPGLLRDETATATPCATATASIMSVVSGGRRRIAETVFVVSVGDSMRD
jgi:hypothetical protein